MIQGWPLDQGATNGTGEWAHVSNNPGYPNTLNAQTCVDNESCWGAVDAVFSSLFIGVLGTSTPIWPMSWGNSSGNASVDLLRTDSQGICYLTSLSGALRTAQGSYFPMVGPGPAASYALVAPAGNGEWWGETWAGPNGSVNASWNCMGYYQNH
jgi:hypothetical protein